jgi:hypothetical protein
VAKAADGAAGIGVDIAAQLDVERGQCTTFRR